MKDRDYYIHQIIDNIKAVERINAKQHKPWNYRLKGLGKHLLGKAGAIKSQEIHSKQENQINDADFRDYTIKSLKHINKKVDSLTKNEFESDPDFDKHPVAYTVEDNLGCITIPIGIAIIIIAFEFATK